MTAKPTILLVEDTVSMSLLYKAYLQDMDAELKLANNGSVALNILESRKIDLILLDLNLPDMDGISILKKLQSENLDIPVIVITANNTVEKAVEAMRYGALDYIVKPFTRERLVTTSKNVMLIHKLESDLEDLSKTIKLAQGSL